MTKIVSFAFVLVGLSSLAGCAPRVTSATALHSVNDVPVFWAYVEAEDRDKSGIYRCGMEDGKPVCKRAKMIAPCNRERCGE